MAAVQIGAIGHPSEFLFGSEIITSSSGYLYAIFGYYDINTAPYYWIEIYKSVNSGASWTRLEHVDGSVINGTYGKTIVSDAAIDANGYIHIVVATAFNDTRDVSYRTFNTADDTWQGAGWEQAAAYGNAPASPGVAISIDSSNKPHVLFMNSVTNMGASYDRIYYTNKTGASWLTPELVSTGTTSNYLTPSILVRATNIIEATYQLDGGTAYYRVRTSGSWGSETSIANGSAISNSIASNTPNRYTATASLIYENNTSIGANPYSATAVSPTYLGTTRYVFYIDDNQDTHLYSNSGAGWVDVGVLDIGTYTGIIAEYAYNAENQSGQLNYIFSDGTYVYRNAYLLTAARSLTATVTTFAEAGSSAALRAARQLPATVGTFTKSGIAVGLSRGHTLTATVTTFTKTGIAAGLTAARKLTAVTGAFTEAGIAASLNRGKVLAATSRTYALAGPDAVLTRGAAANAYTLTANVTTFTEAGIAAGIAAGRKLPATVGTFTKTGIAAGLVAARQLPAVVGSFIKTGSPAGLTAARRFTVAASAFAEVGIAAGLRAARRLPTVVGAFTKAGVVVGLYRGRTLTTNVTTFTKTGTATGLRAARKLTATQTGFTETGIAIGFNRGLRFTAGTGTFTRAGVSAGLRAARYLPTVVRSFTKTGSSAGLTAARQLPATVTTFTKTGTATGLYRGHTLAAATRAYTLTGQDAGWRNGRVLSTGAGAFTEAGIAASLSVTRRLVAAYQTFNLTGQDTTLTYAPPGVPYYYTLMAYIDREVLETAHLSRGVSLAGYIDREAQAIAYVDRDVSLAGHIDRAMALEVRL